MPHARPRPSSVLVTECPSFALVLAGGVRRLSAPSNFSGGIHVAPLATTQTVVNRTGKVLT